MSNVYDASWQRPDANDPRLKPGDGLIFYVSRTDSKCPSAAEVAAHKAKGHIVRFVCEDSATRATGSYSDGLADGQLALAQVKAKGGERGDAVYFACDTAATLSLDYARGFVAGLTNYFTPGCYAGDRNLERARSVGIHLLWQAGASSWSDHWAGNRGAYPYAALYQVAGASPIPGTDLNVINSPAWAGTATSTDWFDMATLDDLKTAFREVLNEGTAAGQQSWADTDKAILGTEQANANRLNALAGAVANSKAAVLAQMQALTPTLTTAVTAALQGAGVAVTEPVVEQALQNVFSKLGAQ